MPSEKRPRCVGGDDVSLNQKVPIAAYDRDSILSDSSMVYMEIVIFIWAIWALQIMIYEL